jgi:hypothetical protein
MGSFTTADLSAGSYAFTATDTTSYRPGSYAFTASLGTLRIGIGRHARPAWAQCVRAPGRRKPVASWPGLRAAAGMGSMVAVWYDRFLRQESF